MAYRLTKLDLELLGETSTQNSNVITCNTANGDTTTNGDKGSIMDNEASVIGSTALTELGSHFATVCFLFVFRCLTMSQLILICKAVRRGQCQTRCPRFQEARCIGRVHCWQFATFEEEASISKIHRSTSEDLSYEEGFSRQRPEQHAHDKDT